MDVYVKNNFNPTDNNKNLTVLRRWKRSLYYITIFPGETETVGINELEDQIVISIAPDSPMRECTKTSRVTFDDCLDMHVDITPPSLIIDYPGGTSIEGNRTKVSLRPGRHDWKVNIEHPEKEVDRWTPGMAPGTAPARVNMVIGDDVDCIVEEDAGKDTDKDTGDDKK